MWQVWEKTKKNLSASPISLYNRLLLLFCSRRYNRCGIRGSMMVSILSKTNLMNIKDVLIMWRPGIGCLSVHLDATYLAYWNYCSEKWFWACIQGYLQHTSLRPIWRKYNIIHHTPYMVIFLLMWISRVH